MKTKTFNDLEHQPHVNWEGTAARMFFANGYGVSVVCAGTGGMMSGSYGADEGLYELAVLEGSADKSTLTYDTPITDDVVGHLSEGEVTAIMKQVQELK